MNTDKLLKELELLADSCESNYALEVNGYSQGVNDSIDLVVAVQREQLITFLKWVGDGFNFENNAEKIVDEYLKKI
jgi:hypothetical protein